MSLSYSSQETADRLPQHVPALLKREGTMVRGCHVYGWQGPATVQVMHKTEVRQIKKGMPDCLLLTGARSSGLGRTSHLLSLLGTAQSSRLLGRL